MHRLLCFKRLLLLRDPQLKLQELLRLSSRLRLLLAPQRLDDCGVRARSLLQLVALLLLPPLELLCDGRVRH